MRISQPSTVWGWLQVVFRFSPPAPPAFGREEAGQVPGRPRALRPPRALQRSEPRDGSEAKAWQARFGGPPGEFPGVRIPEFKSFGAAQ